MLDDPNRLAGLMAAAALVTAALPEREPYPDVFVSFGSLLRALDSAADWLARYVIWERDLLADLGFGLDLGRCAVSGRDLQEARHPCVDLRSPQRLSLR